MYDRDALIANTDLPALADELLGGHRGTNRSPMWPCPNPNHAQTGKTPPVSIFTSHRGEQRWRCHGCGSGGTAIDLVMACCGTGLRDAMDHLARRAGQPEQPPTWTPRKRLRSTMPVSVPAPACADQRGMDRYVYECAAALWSPTGARIRDWLTEIRGIPEDVLHANCIGADLGPQRQGRPDGMPRAAGAVLPVLVDGHAVYAQVRVVNPRGEGPRYLNPNGALAANPRVAHIHPSEQQRQEIIVTEGIIDALSAAAAGFRSAAVLSAAYPDQAVAHHLSRLSQPLVIAFDRDEAGQRAAARLTSLLEAHNRPAVALDLPHDDLNHALVSSSNWSRELHLRVNATLSGRASAVARAIS
jgi:hypothetical protein